MNIITIFLIKNEKNVKIFEIFYTHVLYYKYITALYKYIKF